jgi:oxaloacetate decarboxylase gamma subunit
MTEPDLLLDSLRLMLIGMGIVFSFLLLLVGVLRSMSWVALKLAPIAAQPEPMPLGMGRSGAKTTPAPDAPPVAVIAAAIARYRTDHPGARR